MFAVQFHEYGGPEVLALGEAAEPHAGPGQVRIEVRAASVNPYDWKVRAGFMAQRVPTVFPAIPGGDAAGVVDEVGEGVDGVAVGDEVFGLGSATTAQYAVLSMVAAKPAAMSFTEAAACGIGVETSGRILDLLTLPPGSTLLVDGAAGGVGTALVQLAIGRGLTVVGTASAGRHDYLRSLGAVPTTYGDGLAERVAALAPDGVAGAADLAGKGSVPALIDITGDPTRVVTIVDFAAAALGVHVSAGGGPRASWALTEAARLYEQGRFTVEVERTFSFAEAAAAHALSQEGHVQGKLVLVP